MKGERVATLDLIREVYLTGLVGERSTIAAIAKRLNAPASRVRAALKDAAKKNLLSVVRGVVELTPRGRSRLKVVMLGGAFEIIHPGHLHALFQAKELGNTLVVVVATDESVEKNKGRRPVTGQSARVGLVSSLRPVDLALPGNQGSIYEILLKVRPDVVALGYDQHHSAGDIAREAAKRGLTITTARLGAESPEVKTSKILMST